MARRLFLDLETKSRAALKSTGAHVYAADPSTELLCTGLAWDNEEPWCESFSDLPDEVEEFISAGGEVVIHNGAFELAIINLCAVKKYHWPKLRIEQVSCTMARSYAMALPGSLANSAAALGLPAQKDAVGNRLMLKWSCPNSKGEFPPFDEEEFARLKAYCLQDIRVTQQLDKRLLHLSPKEREIWVMDQQINFRGVYCDVASAQAATIVIESEKERLNAEMRKVTGNEVATFTANAQLTRWVKEQGVETDGVAKADVSRMLSLGGLPAHVRGALEIRQEGAKSSTAKLAAFTSRAGSDQRIRGIFQYHGASTGRWAGRGVQPQNFPRGEYSDSFFDALPFGPDYLQLLGSPTSLISSALRGFLTAGPGCLLYAADFSAIEARVVAWLAGEESVLELFRQGKDIYVYAASDIYGIPPEKVTKEQRQIGKVAILALGYQGGVNAFQAMARGYGVVLAPVAKDLWDRAPHERREKAKWGWKQRGESSGIDKREWIGAELIKLAWREANAYIVDYWHSVEAAATTAVQHPGSLSKVRNVAFKLSGSFLFCRLPSGRALCYPYPKIKDTKTPWGDTRPLLRYKTEDSTRHVWVEEAAYGGKIVENITQAVARDILAEAMLRLEALGYPIVLHVHDEIVSEISVRDKKTLGEFERLVEQIPLWAEGLPLKAGGWSGTRYRK